MGTRFAITCHHPDADLVKRAVAEAFAEGDRINEVASDYIADGELLSLTKHGPGRHVPVSPLLFALLSEARMYAEKTGGLFDPTIGPLTKLWRETRRRGALPDAAALEAARAATGWEKMRLDPAASTAVFTVPGMRLDLGGIAKGQAAERMFRILKGHGISRACITAGGDVRVGDPPPDREGWTVGIRTFDKQAESGSLVLSNAAVSTSGDLRRFVEIGGVRYSHIIDPATGLGLTNHVASTVIAPDAAMSDALDSTACISREAAIRIAKEMGARVL